jgi:putative flippase GtrA
VTLDQRLAASRFLRFALVGAAGFVVNEAALALALKLLHLNTYAGGVFSFVVAVTFTWWGNRTLTFRDRAAAGAGPMLKEWATFVVANGLGFLVNFAVYAGLIALAPAPFNNPFLALAAGTIAGLAFNFAASSRVVFSGNSSDPR